MRIFIIGFTVGAILALAALRLAPPKYIAVFSGQSVPGSVAPAPICGRNTFNVNVNVHRILPGSGREDPLVAALEKRQDALADGLEDRLQGQGIQHEAACPVILDVFGMAHEVGSQRWIVSAHVRLEKPSKPTVVYPAWDSGEYEASFADPTQAQADLTRALTERVEQFLEYFGNGEERGPQKPNK